MRKLALVALLAAAAAGQERPAYLGVAVDDLTLPVRTLWKVQKEISEGAVLVQVVKGSPAAAAGFREGDVVTMFADRPVTTAQDLVDLVRGRKAGDKVAYALRRGTGKISGTLALGRRETDAAAPPAPPPRSHRPPPPPHVSRDGRAPAPPHACRDDDSPAPPHASRDGRAPAPPHACRDDDSPAPPHPSGDCRPPLPPQEGKLEGRLDRLQTDIAQLKRRLLEARARAAPLRHPRSLGGWIHREERLANEARRRGDSKAYRYRAIRLGILKEMREAEFQLPARRLDRVERKLDEVLERLERTR